jgi:hypothetical protein
MFKISTIGLACVIAAFFVWRATLNQPSVRAGAALAPGQIEIPSNLPEADPVGAY